MHDFLFEDPDGQLHKFYAFFGIDGNSTVREIKIAFRIASCQYAPHNNRSRDPDKALMFSLISKAAQRLILLAPDAKMQQPDSTDPAVQTAYQRKLLDLFDV